MILIRTDANEEVATGHLMRCLTIADKVKKLGHEVQFIFKDESSTKVLLERASYIMLSNCGDKDDEIYEMISILKSYKNPVLLLDLYEFDAFYMKQLKPYAKLATFDDMFDEKYPVDLLINYNLYYTKFDYHTRYFGEKIKLLLGGQYVPIREEFVQNLCMVNDKVSSVLLICGGGDKYHILLNLIKKFCKKKLNATIEFIVVVGALNTDIDELKSIEETESKIIVYENVTNLASIMSKVDVVVSAASTVLYEACCMRVPTIFFSVADNQKYDVDCFSCNKLMMYAGDVRENMEEVIDNVDRILALLSEDYWERSAMSEKMTSVIDGNGAQRIAEELVNC